ncbi:DNA/RNA helicase domain-containing protein [Algivirga pacifica]|uniref:DUF2075 domain-containing protein n=1 Tax=Algivirga pacifica TaxID=1162670 RepID=A0ABP9DBW6_9BACT
MSNTNQSFTPVIYSIQELLSLSLVDFGMALAKQFEERKGERPDREEKVKWLKTYELLQKVLPTFKEIPAELVFGYELPGEEGRSPDLILLIENQLLVIEIQSTHETRKGEQIESTHYLRDLQAYHTASGELEITSLRILADAKKAQRSVNGIEQLTDAGFKSYLSSLFKRYKESPIVSADTWAKASYQALPDLREAAKTLFEQQELPVMEKAKEAKLPETMRFLKETIVSVANAKKHQLIFLTGAPGTGKTVAGLQLAQTLDNPLYLTANTAFAEVIQETTSQYFVQNLHQFLSENSTVNTPVIIVDEAQRVWDTSTVSAQGGAEQSEASALLSIGAKNTWSIIVCLVGEGQEIYLGEEKGLSLWEEALESSSTQWDVLVPPHWESRFTYPHQIDPLLHLTTSMRTHLANDLQAWVDALLEGDLALCATLSDQLNQKGFHIDLTRRMSVAKQHIQHIYSKAKEKRYGILSTSHDRLLQETDLTLTEDIAAFYNTSPADTHSCCQLKEYVTEFECQGLDLDYTMVCWGDDLVWNGDRWIELYHRKEADQSIRLRKNAYRVLLSRARDGMMLYVPEGLALDKTYEVLKEAVGATPCGRPKK